MRIIQLRNEESETILALSGAEIVQLVDGLTRAVIHLGEADKKDNEDYQQKRLLYAELCRAFSHVMDERIILR